MKIKMLTLAAGPAGNYYAGMVYQVSKSEGNALIKGGYAEEEKEEVIKEIAPEIIEEKPKKRKKK